MKILISMHGQSNEAGTTLRWISANGHATGFGADTSQSGTYLNRLAEMIARRKRHLVVPHYAAFGGTSLPYTYVGFCQNWSSRSWPVGSIILSGGGVWRRGTLSTEIGGAQSCTVAPTGTTDITTGDGRAWKYLGTPGVKDVAGTIYVDGDTNRFDPYGRLAATSFDAVAKAQQQGYDLKIALVSWGQQDSADTTVTQAVYRDSLISLANALIGRGFDRVYLGMTIDYPANRAFYTSKLVPAVTEAVAALASTGKVFAGANQFAALGNLSTVTSPWARGLKADAIHGTEALQVPMAQAWYDVLEPVL